MRSLGDNMFVHVLFVGVLIDRRYIHQRKTLGGARRVAFPVLKVLAHLTTFC